MIPPSSGTRPATGKSAFCHITVRANQMMLTSISPDLNPGAISSVWAYRCRP